MLEAEIAATANITSYHGNADYKYVQSYWPRRRRHHDRRLSQHSLVSLAFQRSRHDNFGRSPHRLSKASSMRRSATLQQIAFCHFDRLAADADFSDFASIKALGFTLVYSSVYSHFSVND